MRLAAVLLGFATTVHPQQVLTLPGKTIEVIGLKRWTIAMIQDSMAKYAPGENLESHACAAILRYKLGFADASAGTWFGYGPTDTITRVVISVVEPQDSVRVRHRRLPMDTTKPYQPWAEAVRIVGRMNAVMELARSSVGRHDTTLVSLPGWARRDSATFRRYEAFVASHRTESDYRTALRILDSDPDYRNRLVAISILANFTDRDTTIYALTDALMETDGIVKSMADMVLEAFVNKAPRRVAWGPKAESLHALLNGNISTTMEVVHLLSQTGVDPSLAVPLLRNGGESVLALLAAEHPQFQFEAKRLLIALAGKTIRGGAAEWGAWIRSL